MLIITNLDAKTIFATLKHHLHTVRPITEMDPRVRRRNLYTDRKTLSMIASVIHIELMGRLIG